MKRNKSNQHRCGTLNVTFVVVQGAFDRRHSKTSQFVVWYPKVSQWDQGCGRVAISRTASMRNLKHLVARQFGFTQSTFCLSWDRNGTKMIAAEDEDTIEAHLAPGTHKVTIFIHVLQRESSATHTVGMDSSQDKSVGHPSQVDPSFDFALGSESVQGSRGATPGSSESNVQSADGSPKICPYTQESLSISGKSSGLVDLSRASNETNNHINELPTGLAIDHETTDPKQKSNPQLSKKKEEVPVENPIKSLTIQPPYSQDASAPAASNIVPAEAVRSARFLDEGASESVARRKGPVHATGLKQSISDLSLEDLMNVSIWAQSLASEKRQDQWAKDLERKLGTKLDPLHRKLDQLQASVDELPGFIGSAVSTLRKMQKRMQMKVNRATKKTQMMINNLEKEIEKSLQGQAQEIRIPEGKGDFATVCNTKLDKLCDRISELRNLMDPVADSVESVHSYQELLSHMAALLATGERIPCPRLVLILPAEMDTSTEETVTNSIWNFLGGDSLTAWTTKKFQVYFFCEESFRCVNKDCPMELSVDTQAFKWAKRIGLMTLQIAASIGLGIKVATPFSGGGADVNVECDVDPDSVLGTFAAMRKLISGDGSEGRPIPYKQLCTAKGQAYDWLACEAVKEKNLVCWRDKMKATYSAEQNRFLWTSLEEYKEPPLQNVFL